MRRLALGVCCAGVLLPGGPPPSSWKAAELGHGQQSTWTAPATLVYHDAPGFRTGWAQLYPATSDRPALPAIDFAKWRVIVVAIGTRPTGGYFLSLDRGQVVRDSAVIGIVVHVPPRGCGVSQELTTPAIAIATPVAPGPFRIVLNERADSAHCR